MDYHEIERHAEEYRRIRYAIRTQRRVTFSQYLAARERYDQIAQQRLRDWSDNQRLAFCRYPIHLN